MTDAPVDTGGAVVTTTRSGRVLLITLNRPQARNAVDPDVARELEAAIDLLETDGDLWVGVLTGAGPLFCAGADLKAVAAGQLSELMTDRGGFAGIVTRRRVKPLVAAIQGDALAGGLEIAIACDVIVAAADARLGIPETARSLLAVGGALSDLPRLIGEKAALELAMTGTLWPVERFRELGLVSRVVAAGDVVDVALALATSICANAPLAVRASRKAVVDGRDRPASERMALGLDLLAQIEMTADYQEGPRAFLEKRAPRWQAR